ncbi:beta-lactamase/transpeptidase-like protein [Eremomyces bilateralis CBS 781.70]|uniref:Beta-lactamase/transpeptidase-like protein n=1 Tax=Eremomyces bilateralis CBS 781.70 TaxID=1392243 RepID=A0A6G1GI67_9PEZI|nr:beta-lactamase/transpeptidase-like protein [Eremomyces bilateralis CBS 781.70]KAF1817672.1 beta-lactamase/transpeptidase-like protein [Eremomyces bilateralis CBS 781.70]
MSEFDDLLAKFTEKGHAKVHGALFQCVDKHGNEIYNKISGYDSLGGDAAPLREDCVLKMTSGSKLMASIALLQCVDKGLIGLDEPIAKVLPELEDKEILKLGSESELISEPSKTKITARHLLTHTSGLAYRFLNPLLIKWATTPAAQQDKIGVSIAEKYNVPLVFEPGDGWAYGVGIDWAGLAVRRLHGGMSLEDYMNENIWSKVGLSAPFPTFQISKDPEYKSRLMKAAERTPDGLLQPFEFWQGDNPNEQDGGHGLVATAKDYLAVLADLISDSPKLLKPETIALAFEPQIAPGSPAMTMLQQLRPAWETISGPVSNSEVNHGLLGLLLTGNMPEIGQPKGILGWGGAAGTIWFVSKESGVAGIFGTQISPFGDAAVKELINAWKKDFWSGFNAA